MIYKTDLNGVEEAFPELKRPKGWGNLIRRPNADYYILSEDNVPYCFCGVIIHDNTSAKIAGLYSTKEYWIPPTAIFELMDYVSFLLMEYNVKIFVINEVAKWGWKKLGFKVIRSKQFKYYMGYWMKRPKIY